MYSKDRLASSCFQSLLSACIEGDNRSQWLLYNSYIGYGKTVSSRYTSCETEAEDVLIESFYKIFSSLASYNPSFSFKAWIRRIIINTAISSRRRYKFDDRKIMSIEDVQIGYARQEVISLLTVDEIMKLADQMKPAYKRVFLLHAVDGYKHREIADLMQMNEATVRSIYVRSKKMLKKLLIQYDTWY